MLTAWLMVLALSALCIAIHYEVMLGIIGWVPHLCSHYRCRVVVAVVILFLAHVVEIWLFPGGQYAAINWFGLGEFKGEFTGTIRDYAYFSTITFTSVGYGDIRPQVELKIIVGLEALTVLLMIAWSGLHRILPATPMGGRSRNLEELNGARP